MFKNIFISPLDSHKTVYSPLFFSKIVEIEREAILDKGTGSGLGGSQTAFRPLIQDGCQ